MYKFGWLLLTICLFSCSDHSAQYLIGKWQIMSILEGKEEITLSDNWMHLQSDGLFISFDGSSNRTERGRWTYNAHNQQLYIHSDAESEAESEWIMSMSNDTLQFSSTTSELILFARKLEF